jgi:hypothetical protein
LAAVYMLWMYQRIMFGEVTHAENMGLKDLNLREVVVLVPVVLVIVWIGMYPQSFLKRMEASTRTIVERVVLVAKSRAAPGGTMRCVEGCHIGHDAAIRAHPLQGLAPHTCRESRHTVPETEG